MNDRSCNLKLLQRKARPPSLADWDRARAREEPQKIAPFE